MTEASSLRTGQPVRIIPLGAAKLQLPVEEPWNGCNFAAAATTTVSRLASSLLYLIVNRTILFFSKTFL
jgi:hypothetical protein